MRLSPRCYAVTGLAYSPPWCVNAGFIAGDTETLVLDTGGNALAGQTVHGYSTAVRPENRLRVLNTEKHFDHIGGNAFFRAQGVDIWGHKALARTPAEFQAEREEFNAIIPNPQRRAAGEAAAFFHGTELTNPTCFIGQDTRWDLGNCAVEILLTPGHTDTNLSTWVPTEGVLYTGDCLIAEYLPNLDAGTPADWQVWLASIDRLAALEPAIVVMGHGPVARGAQVRTVIGYRPPRAGGIHRARPLPHRVTEKKPMPVLLQIPENPNCDAMDAQVFQCRAAARVVTQVLCERPAGMEWCAVTGVDEGGAPCPATACLVEDSGDGACYLVIGGEWGLRLQPAGTTGPWDLASGTQWGVPYFLLAGDGATLHFAD